ncbi:MAG: hypothetical protein ACOC5E_00385 [Acidobacteriota bacterium]
MTRFRIDSPDIDVEALQRRVEEAVERKRGKRFTDRELEELRRAPLRPRVRREDLPRGMVEGMREARTDLPEPPPRPGPGERAEPRPLDRSPRSRPDFSELLSRSARGGAGGKLLAVVRRLLRPLFRLGPNVDYALGQVGEYLDWLVDRDDRYLDHAQQRIDLSRDALDRRVDHTADWAGAHMSTLGGALDRRQERQLHLFHNLVYELTSARLDLEQMQDRLNELTRRVEAMQARERTLESLVLSEEDEESGARPAG